MTANDDEIKQMRARFEKLAWTLGERMRRLFAAAEASASGRGGVSKVALATGVSRRAILVGLAELAAENMPVEGQEKRTRKTGAGRQSVIHRREKHAEGAESPCRHGWLLGPVRRHSPRCRA